MWKDAYGTDLTFSARLPHPKHAPYEATSGYLREEAIMVLRRFYITENTNGNSYIIYCSGSKFDFIAIFIAPKPKSKANRVLKTEVLPAKKD